MPNWKKKKIKEEHLSLGKRNHEINSILKSKSKLNNLIINDLDILSDEFSTDRKTGILKDTESSKLITKQIKISDEPMSIVLSSNGWIKAYKGLIGSIEKMSFKSGDSYLTHINIDNDKEVSFFDQKGFVYSMRVNDIPTGRGYGESLKKYFSINDGVSVTGLINSSSSINTLLVSDSGYGFMCMNNNLVSSNRNGKSIVKNKNSNIIKPVPVDVNNSKYYVFTAIHK